MNSFVFNDAQRTKLMFFDVQYKREINNSETVFACFGYVAYIKNVVFTNKISINIIKMYLIEINN